MTTPTLTNAEIIDRISSLRAEGPGAVLGALASRQTSVSPLSGRHMIIAADHPARGALGAGREPRAMANRAELLRRCVIALGRDGVTGFLGTADMVEDLALLGALEGKWVFGSMNRGGLQGATFEMDDRFTGYDAAGVKAAGLDGGKMLLRIDYRDEATAPTLEACANAVSDLARLDLIAMVEPFISRRNGGAVVNDLLPDAVISSIAITSGLAYTSAYTWLKIPTVPEMDRVMESTTLPTLILGGAVDDEDVARRRWADALRLPNVRGLVVGRALLYPADDDVATSVDRAVGLL
jgi:hypothetical protein